MIAFAMFIIFGASSIPDHVIPTLQARWYGYWHRAEIIKENQRQEALREARQLLVSGKYMDPAYRKTTLRLGEILKGIQIPDEFQPAMNCVKEFYGRSPERMKLAIGLIQENDASGLLITPAMIYATADRLEEARKIMLLVKKLDQPLPDTACVLVIDWIESGDLSGARKSINVLLEFYPESVTLTGIDDLLKAHEGNPDSIGHLLELVRNNPKDKFLLLSALNELSARGQGEEIDKLLIHVTKCEPESFFVNAMAGAIFFCKSLGTKGKDMLETTRRLSPTKPDDILTPARFLADWSAWSQVEALLQCADMRWSDYPEFLKLWARVHYSKNQIAKLNIIMQRIPPDNDLDGQRSQYETAIANWRSTTVKGNTNQ